MLMFALEKGPDKEVVELLLSKGADATAKDYVHPLPPHLTAIGLPLNTPPHNDTMRIATHFRFVMFG